MPNADPSEEVSVRAMQKPADLSEVPIEIRPQRWIRRLVRHEEPLTELNSEAIGFRVASECFAPCAG